MKKPRIIVSLTSFPAAISYAAGAVRSILNGSVLPDKVVLYLDTQKFPGGVLPPEVEALKRNPIFEVRFDPAEIRSYKKLIPALRDFPDDIIVTVDDDVRYHRGMLGDLLRLHRQHPDVILAHRAKHVKLDTPYSKWRKYRWYNFIFHKLYFDHHIMQTGVGGVLYPPRSLDTEILDQDLFTAIAPTNDDVWFWAAAVSKGTYVVPVPLGNNKPRGLGKPDPLSLKTYNLKSATDFNRVALEGILEKYPAIKQRLIDEK